MQLKPGTSLQNGKYEIIRTLGQGGFGITYLAEHTMLQEHVAVKEFFMKDVCNRDAETSQVIVPSVGSKALVEKFMVKFVKEARTIWSLDHPNIVRVTDVFEENGTAYYVMENLPGGSLADKVKREGPLPEALADKYIRQVADALAYIHSQNMVHLDVKPSNILLNAKGDAVLIDFGISKHYDDAGEQTSSTPIGISRGFAPLEQGRNGDVRQFKPSTDIYALGATLYFLLTGDVPPEASIVNEGGLKKPECVSPILWSAIETAMQPRSMDRPQSVVAFISFLDAARVQSVSAKESENTVIDKSGSGNTDRHIPRKPWLWGILAGLTVAAIVVAVILGSKGSSERQSIIHDVDSTVVDVADTLALAVTDHLKTAESKPTPHSTGSAKTEPSNSTSSPSTAQTSGAIASETQPVKAEFKARILRNGVSDTYESSTFKDGDDLFISFQAPIDGYVAVYLYEMSSVSRLLPMRNSSHSAYHVSADTKYVFFANGVSRYADVATRSDIHSDYGMTCSGDREVNRVYIVFSPNSFTTPGDDVQANMSTPASIGFDGFQKWLGQCRSRDREMIYKISEIIISK